MAIPSSPTTGTKHKFGTLRVNGAVQANPTRPWRPDQTPAGTPGKGDIPQYSSGSIEIGNSDSSDANKINWVYVGNGKFISDRNILCAASWNTLSSQGFFNGVTTTIDGTSVKITLISGGVKDRTSGSTGANGGTPTDNEWDRFIQNEAGISGLTVPVAADKDISTLTADDYNRAHNQFWNWYFMYSWCKEVYEPNTPHRVSRGYNTASNLSYSNPTSTLVHYGFRPVLEVLEAPPTISDTDRSLGNFSSAPTVQYSVTEGARIEKFTLQELVDSTEIRTLTNQSTGSFTISPAAQWAGLSSGSHTLTVKAINSAGTATRTYTFNKTNTPPPGPGINAPISGHRIAATGYVEFTPGRDAEGNAQTFKLQFATNSGFTTGLLEFSTGLQKLSGGSWVNSASAADGDIGSRFRLPYSGVPMGVRERYIRVIASDGTSTGNSAAVAVFMGDRLQYKSHPKEYDFMPKFVIPIMEKVIDDKADVQMFACNNGLDAEPAWEDCTAEYKAGKSYYFSNTVKTAEKWAVALWCVVDANDATGAIQITAIGRGAN